MAIARSGSWVNSTYDALLDDGGFDTPMEFALCVLYVMIVLCIYAMLCIRFKNS